MDEVTKSKVLGVYSLNDELLSKKQEILLKKFNCIKIHLTILSDYGHGMISKDFRRFSQKSKFIAVNVQVNGKYWFIL